MGGGHHETLDDDEEHQRLSNEEAEPLQQQQQAASTSVEPGAPSPSPGANKKVKDGQPPLNTKSRCRRPYQTGCLGCLSRVPGVSMASWLIVCIGCGCYVGGNVVWTKLAAEFLLGKLCPVFPWFVIAVAGLTVLLATKCLIIDHYASGETSRHELLSPGRNCATRCCDGFALTLAYIFQFLWTFLFTAQILPLLLLLATTTLREPTLRGCVDLRHYGMRVKAPDGAILPVVAPPPQQSPEIVDVNLPTTTTPASYVYGSNSTHNSTISYRIVGPYRKSAHLCGRDLDNFAERSFSFLIAISFAIVGALLVLIGMLNFIICLAGNYKHVKEIRHLPYTAAIGGDEYMTEKAAADEHDAKCRMLQHEG